METELIQNPQLTEVIFDLDFFPPLDTQSWKVTKSQSLFQQNAYMQITLSPYQF